jgi:hypothetical protein
MFPLDEDLRRIALIHFRGKKGFAWSEDFFLAQITAGTSKHDVYWATLALRDCGTPRCVPALKGLAAHPKQDVRDCAILTIARISGSAETPYFVERLLGPKGQSKTYALWAIGAVGDERALPAVVQYVRKNKKNLSADTDDPRQQQEILAYLYRMKETDLIKEFSFLAPPLRSLSRHLLSVFLQRVPGILDIVAVPGA